MLIIFGLLALGGVNGAAHAEDVTYQTEVDPSIQITIPTELIKVYVEPGSKPFDSNSVDISVSTNSHSGYYMVMSSDSTSLLKLDDISKDIPTLSTNEGGYTEETFETNKWGYKIGSANYIPFVSGAEIARSDTVINEDVTTLTFAAKVDYYQPSGVYQTVLDFFAVANPTIMTIQNLDAAYCTEDPMVVVDARDGEEYTIQKFADGNCWMLDNLRLDPTTVSLAALKSRTNASNESLSRLKNGGGDSPYAINAVSTDWAGVRTVNWGTGYSSPYVYVDYKDTVDSEARGNGSGKYGVYYNYCAATAGSYCYAANAPESGVVNEDICPAGWKLPGGQYGNGPYDSGYNHLIAAYHDTIREALSLPFAGEFYDYSDGPDSTVYQVQLWASNYDYSRYMTKFYIDSYSPGGHIGTDVRDRGLPIRCIMKPTIASAVYLQDVTQEMIDNTALGATAILKDKRDNETYKIGKLADGKLWMLENLRLDPIEVSLESLQGNTNASDETLNYLKNGGGTDQYAAEAVAIAVNISRRDTPTVIVDYKDTIPSAENGSSGKAGVYYSYCAASAGSFCYSGSAPYVPGTYNSPDLTEDICPAGWRMPTGHQHRNAAYEYEYSDFRNLLSSYNNSLSDFFAAFHVTLASGFYSYYPGDSIHMGSNGYLWAASQEVPSSGNLMTFSWGTSPNFNIAGTDRSRIFNIRCMFKD